jgi:hypothetical protein
MAYGILACCVEENYLHNVRRAINSLKKNVVDIKHNTMIKIRTLLETNKKLMIKNMLDEIKNLLNCMKITKPKNYGMFYYKIDISNEYYLYYLISRNIGGSNSDWIWEYDNCSWVECKKYIIKDITKVLNNATIDELYECFEDGLDEFGKFKFNKEYKNNCGYEYIFDIKLELYDSFYSDNELLKNGKGNDSKLEDLIRV